MNQISVCRLRQRQEYLGEYIPWGCFSPHFLIFFELFYLLAPFYAAFLVCPPSRCKVYGIFPHFTCVTWYYVTRCLCWEFAGLRKVEPIQFYYFNLFSIID
jgi:hypothetical protein